MRSYMFCLPCEIQYWSEEAETPGGQACRVYECVCAPGPKTSLKVQFCGLEPFFGSDTAALGLNSCLRSAK